MLKEEVVIRFSRRKAMGGILLFLPFCLFGVFLFVQLKERAFGILTFLFFAFFMGMSIRSYLSRAPQLILSKQGITIGKKPIMYWSDIENARISWEAGNKTILHYLVLDHFGVEVKFLVDDLEMSVSEITSWLAVYRNNCKP